MNMELLKQVQEKNCKAIIPTGWNVYEWAEEHPDTTIAHGLKRMEKIFDFTDGNALFFGFSCGKDSTVSAQLAVLELHLRKLRVEAGVDRHGNETIDPLDAKWYGCHLYGMYTDAEVCWSSSNDYGKRFLQRMGPEGLDLIHFVWVCMEMAWQSGVSFNSGILISWSEEWGEDSPNHWVQPMPTKEDLHGFQCLTMHNRREANPVPLSSLSPAAQQFHRAAGNVITIPATSLFAYAQQWKQQYGPREEVEAVANYGRGPVLENLRPGCHEKEQQDDHSLYFSKTSWLVSTLSE